MRFEHNADRMQPECILTRGVIAINSKPVLGNVILSLLFDEGFWLAKVFSEEMGCRPAHLQI